MGIICYKQIHQLVNVIMDSLNSLANVYNVANDAKLVMVLFITIAHNANLITFLMHSKVFV